MSKQTKEKCVQASKACTEMMATLKLLWGEIVEIDYLNSERIARAIGNVAKAKEQLDKVE